MGEGARGILWVLVMQRQPAQPLADVVHRCSWRVVVHAAGGGVLAVEQRADTDVPAADERSAHRSVHTHTTYVQPCHAKCDLSRLNGSTVPVLLLQFCFPIYFSRNIQTWKGILLKRSSNTMIINYYDR